jgi:hypothetical protein
MLIDRRAVRDAKPTLGQARGRHELKDSRPGVISR